MTRREQKPDPQYAVIRPGAGQPAGEPHSAEYGGQRIIIVKNPGPQHEYFWAVYRREAEIPHHKGYSETPEDAKEAAAAIIRSLCGCPCPDCQEGDCAPCIGECHLRQSHSGQ